MNFQMQLVCDDLAKGKDVLVDKTWLDHNALKLVAIANKRWWVVEYSSQRGSAIVLLRRNFEEENWGESWGDEQ